MNTSSDGENTYYYNSFDILTASRETDLDATFESYKNFLIERNPEKYKDFGDSIEKTNYLAMVLNLEDRELRVRLLKMTYLAMRIIDDICDSDILIELSDDERLELVEEIYNGNYSRVPVLDATMTEISKICVILGQSESHFEISYSDGLHQIIHSMRYDLLRILDDEPKRTRRELEENFYKMDIHGTEGNSAMLLGIDPNNTIEKVLFLGRASRIAYSLQDLSDDISKKIINIPIEDLEKYDISDEDLEMVGKMENLSDADIPLGIKKWIKQEIEQAKELLQMHDDIFNIVNTITNPPLEWGSYVSNVCKSSVMILAFKKAYKKEILDILEKTEKEVTGLDEIGLESINPSRLFSISESLTKVFTYFYAHNSWDIESEIKTDVVKQSDVLCDKYSSILEITSEEKEKYYAKSKNLSLMYIGFLDAEYYSEKELHGCVQAAFLSCAYDVCTDWGKGEGFKEKFETILGEEVSDELSTMAMDLFKRDTGGKLEDDGLDRGSVTMRFIGGCSGMTNEVFIERYGVDLDQMGRYLQMVDDVMDVEEDFEEFEHNFLANKHSREKNLEDFLTFFKKDYFHKQSLLQIGINLSMKKAKKILEYLQNNQ